MATLEELLGKAKSEARPHMDVDVSLAAGVAQRAEDLEAEHREAAVEMAALEAEGRFTDKRRRPLQERMDSLREKIAEVEAEARSSLVTLRFTALKGGDWALLTGSSVARPGVAIDLGYQYNYHEVCTEAGARSVQRVEDGVTSPVSPETFREILDVVSGNDFERIMSAVFAVNVWSSSEDLRLSKKASAGTTANSSN